MLSSPWHSWREMASSPPHVLLYAIWCRNASMKWSDLFCSIYLCTKSKGFFSVCVWKVLGLVIHKLDPASWSCHLLWFPGSQKPSLLLENILVQKNWLSCAVGCVAASSEGDLVAGCAFILLVAVQLLEAWHFWCAVGHQNSVQQKTPRTVLD